MSYYIVDRMGGGEDEDDNPSVDRMRFHLNSLDPEDEEHGSVRLVHRESRWGLEYFGDRLILENTTMLDSHRHLIGVSTQKALELWMTLSEGKIDEVMQEPWKPGYA
jgi:hypothetical protein